MGSTQGAFKKDIITLEVFSHTKFTGIEVSLSKYMWEIKKLQGGDLLLKRGKRTYRKYKARDSYCLQYMEEKFAIASYNKPNEMLSQRLEIVYAFRHKKKTKLQASLLKECDFKR